MPLAAVMDTGVSERPPPPDPGRMNVGGSDLLVLDVLDLPLFLFSVLLQGGRTLHVSEIDVLSHLAPC